MSKSDVPDVTTLNFPPLPHTSSVDGFLITQEHHRTLLPRTSLGNETEGYREGVFLKIKQVLER